MLANTVIDRPRERVAAYAADPDSLGPMQALAGFSRSHRETWGALRDRLPVQLGDVGEQVTSVFDAIDEDVAPLESLLPETPSESGGSGKHRGAPESASTGSSGADRSTAPSSGSSASDGRGSSSSPSKSASGSTGEDEGLLGGSTGGLLDPPNSTGSTTPSAGDPALPEPDVTLPPLLPGLLPGLGIDTEDAD